MQIEQIMWTTPNNYNVIFQEKTLASPQLLMVFGARNLISKKEYINSMRKKYPSAYIIGCSTAGEIFDSQVANGSVISTAIQFKYTTIDNVSVEIRGNENSYKVGAKLVKRLKKDKLTHIFVLSEGLNINATELINGMKDNLPESVAITGGLAADGNWYEETLVISDTYAKENVISAIGFYGDRIQIGYGTVNGLEPFGREMLITKSKDNILYELDGKPAIDRYKIYIRKYSKDLPYSGLLFPLSFSGKGKREGLVRSLLKINEEDQSMIYAGDVPEGNYAKLMKPNIERLINGAKEAAEASLCEFEETPSLAILVSCVGRKNILNTRVEDEIEAVREVFGERCIFAGFYSYGEISPYRKKVFNPNGQNSMYNMSSELHNQSMSITTIREI